MKNIKLKNELLILLMLCIAILSSCGESINNITQNTGADISTNTNTGNISDDINPLSVSVSKISQLKSIKKNMQFPATVVSQNEIKVISKSNGTISKIYVNMGDSIKKDQVLLQIDEKNNTIVVTYQQAQVSYKLAKQSYENLQKTIPYDLKQLEISKDQSKTNEVNIGDTTSESYKSTVIAYESSKLALNQAQLNLNNNKVTIDQSIKNAKDNLSIVSDNAMALVSTTINAINNATGFNENKSLSLNYYNILGANKSATKSDAKQKYDRALSSYESYIKNEYIDVTKKADDTLKVLDITKQALIASRVMFENTPESQYLPYNATSGGSSISGFIMSMNGYVSQIETMNSQLNMSLQGLNNSILSSKTQIDALQKAYELAQKQVDNAYQALNNAKANIKSQKDITSYATLSVENQYNTTKTKLESQLEISKTQLDIAEKQLENAKIAYDNLIIKSPFDGSVIQKLVTVGDVINAGTPLFNISQPKNLKLQFYVNQDILPYIYEGMKIKVIDSNIDVSIINISKQADIATKKFLIEADVMDQNLIPGTIVNVQFNIEKKINNGIYLPIDALVISSEKQDFDGHIFKLINNNQVKKWYVKIIKIEGEYIHIKDDLNDNDIIVVDGTQFLTDNAFIRYE